MFIVLTSCKPCWHVLGPMTATLRVIVQPRMCSFQFQPTDTHSLIRHSHLGQSHAGFSSGNVSVVGRSRGSFLASGAGLHSGPARSRWAIRALGKCRFTLHSLSVWISHHDLVVMLFSLTVGGFCSQSIMFYDDDDDFIMPPNKKGWRMVKRTSGIKISASFTHLAGPLGQTDQRRCFRQG